MKELSFRQAAQATGHSVGAIQNALKRGDLKSLNENELLIWSYGRSDRHEVLAAQRTLYRMMVDALFHLKKWKDEGRADFDELAYKCVLGFVIKSINLDDDRKYSFSEAYFDNSRLGKALSEDPEIKDETSNLETRFYISVLDFALNEIAALGEAHREFLGIDVDDIRERIIKFFQNWDEDQSAPAVAANRDRPQDDSQREGGQHPDNQ